MLIAHMTAVFNTKRHTNTIMQRKRFSRKYQKRALNYHESIHRVFFASGVVIKFQCDGSGKLHLLMSSER